MPSSSRERFAATIRRNTPQFVVPMIVNLRYKRALKNQKTMDDARAQMRFLLEKSQPDADIEEHARQYVYQWLRRAEVRWRYKMVNFQDVEGMEGLIAMQESGRGGLLNFSHHGQYEGAFPSIARKGVVTTVLVHPGMLQPDAPEHMKQRVRVGGELCEHHSIEIGMKGMVELVKQGKIVAIVSDSPGSAALTYAGRQVKGSSGAARVAMNENVPVAVMTTRLDASGNPKLHIGTPLDPADFSGPEEMLAEMVRQHEEAHLAWPAAADNPLSRWTIVEDSPAG